MLNNETEAGLNGASQARVKAHELMDALASLESIKAKREFDQVGTVTLAEGVRDCGLETTPEELQTETTLLREADAVREKVKRRHRRMRLILVSEYVSAALCLMTLVGFQHTLFSKKWQQARQTQNSVRQAQDFNSLLRLSRGPHPRYIIHVVPISTRSWGPAGEIATTVGDGASRPAYPAYLLPDGTNIHAFGGLSEEGRDSDNYLPFDPLTTAYVEFLDVGAYGRPFFRDNMIVFYNGTDYRRGWVRKSDVPRVLSGHSFTLFPALVASPPFQIPDIVPLTISQRSIRDAHGRFEQSYPDLYDIFTFPEGSHVHLDSHAWERYQNTSEGG